MSLKLMAGWCSPRSLLYITAAMEHTYTQCKAIADMLSATLRESFVRSVSQQIISGEFALCDFRCVVSTVGPTSRTLYRHFWHHFLEILDSTQSQSLHKTLVLSSELQPQQLTVKITPQKGRGQNSSVDRKQLDILRRPTVIDIIRGGYLNDAIL